VEELPDTSMIKFDSRGLVPCVVQECGSGRVLMLAYMNEASLRQTLETGLTTFWSRSRQCFWQKGGTSGNVQRVRLLQYDCDGDTLLALVDQTGPACHTGSHSCFDGRFIGPSVDHCLAD
jgi:phosphoribosyl-AMP cyclohydrolase